MPHQICHAHCPRGGGGRTLLVVLAVVVIAASARAVVHAAEVVLKVVLIAAGSVLGLGAIAVAAFAALRVRRWHARNRQAMVQHARTIRALSARPVAAIEVPRPGLAALAAEYGDDVLRRPGGAPED